MKERHIIYYLSGTLLFMLLFLMFTADNKLHHCGQFVLLQVESTFPNAIKKAVEDKMEKENLSIPDYIYNPEKKKIREYETRTATYPDTTITFQAKVVSREDYVSGLCQTYLLDAGKLEPGSIKLALDSMLHIKGINIRTEVGVTSAFYTQIDKWSSDTTQFSAKQCFSILKQGNYEDINYYVLVDYPIATIWKLMPKMDLYFLVILIAITIFIICHIQIKKAKGSNAVLKASANNYITEEALINVQNKVLVVGKNQYKLSPQQYELLMLFIQADKQRVNKEAIKSKFWPKQDEAGSNMTTCISRLKKKLQQTGSGYTIITDPTNEDFYCLATVKSCHLPDC